MKNMVLKSIARQIINTSLGIRKGEMVRINTWAHSLELASELAIECYRKGAVPLVTLTSDEMFKEGLSLASMETLASEPRHEVAMLHEVDAQIMISGPANPDILREVPAEKIQAYRSGGVEISRIQQERGIRTVQVHLGKVTKERAEKYGFDFEAWRRAMLDAFNIDYAQLYNFAKELEEKVLRGKTLRIVSKTGTDLQFEINHESIILDDGIIDEDDIKKNHYITNLPAGILDLMPLENTGSGRIIVDSPQYRLGERISNTVMEFKEGKLISLNAKNNKDTLEETFQRICSHQPRLTRIGIGLNPRMQEGYLFDEVILGKVSVAVGGECSSCFVSGALKEATVYVDDSLLFSQHVQN